MVDRSVWYVLIAAALSAIIIVLLIILFTGKEAWEAITGVGVLTMIFDTVWRPGSIIGVEGAQYGMLPMIAGAILSTFGAMVLGLPLSLGAAILLTEVAPAWVRELFQPAIELLAGIPSVVYGFFGLIILTDFIRVVFGLPTGETWLAASILLGIMALPTIISVSEDAISSVPREYKEGSLAIGATGWQTISRVIVPAALSGIAAAIILGIGRAIGETMAVMMVAGNAAIIPDPIWNVLSPLRTLTGTLGIEMGEVPVPIKIAHAVDEWALTHPTSLHRRRSTAGALMGREMG